MARKPAEEKDLATETETPNLGDDRAALVAENETLKARLAAVEEQLKHKGDRFNVQGDIDGAEYFRVQLPSGPNHVVKAIDAANAYATYKKEMGVIASEHEPTISAATEAEYAEAQDKRFGRDRDKPRGAPKAPDPDWNEETQTWKHGPKPVAGIKEAEQAALAAA